jgi:hypothetical protein
MRDLQDQILQDESVAAVTAAQESDGWLAWNFHGYDSMESGIRILCEKGVQAERPALGRALIALRSATDRLERGLGTPGKILDDLGFGGAEAIRASLFALAGEEEQLCVQDQVQLALDAFNFAAQVTSLEDVHEQYKNHLVFRKGISWPGTYHLRLLAWTKNWRTPANNKMMERSIRNLIQFSPIPDIHVKYKAQVIAPASFCMHHFKSDLKSLSDAEWMQWFHRMELLARAGMISQNPELLQQVRDLKSMLLKNNGLFTKRLNHPYFQKWGAYTGLALEKDWHSPQCRINDLTFRSLLVLNYSGLEK